MFTKNTGQPISCEDLDGKKYDALQRLEALAGKHDFIEQATDYLWLAQMVGTRHKQEDRLFAGYIPSEYFIQKEDLRQQVITRAHKNLQNKLTALIPEAMWQSGATAMLVLTDGENIDIGYLGDSEVFLLIEEDHKIVSCELLNPYLHQVANHVEKQRVYAEGGIVRGTKDNPLVERLFGCLLLTRALGNNRFNQPNDTKDILSRTPTCLSKQLTLTAKQTASLLVATDGLTCLAKLPHHAEYVRKYLPIPGESSGVSTFLAQALKELRDRGSIDDISLAYLKLTKGMYPTYVAMFDGHGGEEVSSCAYEQVTEVLSSTLTAMLQPSTDQPKGSNPDRASQDTVATLPVDSPISSPAIPEMSELLGTLGKFKRSKSYHPGTDSQPPSSPEQSFSQP